MNQIETIIQNNMDVWEACWQEPFVQELVSGTLPMEKFKGYVLQDGVYLRELARVFAMGMSKAPTMAEMQVYYSLLSFVNENENSTRLQYLNQWEISLQQAEECVLTDENKAYMQFLMECAEHKSMAELIIAVLPCMLSYQWLAKKMLKTNPQALQGPYGPFWQDYVTAGYDDACENWRAFAQKQIETADEQQLARLNDIFRDSSIHEQAFWKMSYQGNQ